MIGARVPQCLRQFHKLDTAGRGLQGEQRGDGAGLEKQPVWSDKKRADQGADRERWRQRQEERFGGVGDGGWGMACVQNEGEKMIGNRMRPQIERTEQNESLQNMG